MKPASVFVEEEVECHLCRIIDIVKEKLTTMPSTNGKPDLFPWRTPFYDIKVVIFALSDLIYISLLLVLLIWTNNTFSCCIESE